MAGAGLWSSLWAGLLPVMMSPSPNSASGLVVPWANGTSMPHGRRERTNGLDTGDQREQLTWAYLLGAGDGNRTRTISLGICIVRACYAA
jgi:hypothetical protein